MWNWEARGETEAQRLDRNWNSLVQEARIVQTGVQLLTGFLLILPFQSRFDALSDPMRGLYLVTVTASIVATVFLVAPVSTHRLLFRRRRLDEVVRAAHTFDLVGVVLLGVALTGVAVLIFAVVLGNTAGVIAGCCFAALFTLVWGIYPWYRRGHGPESEDRSEYPEPQ
ncbi:Uncharacterised protein [Nocardia otitidiscaviarum]|uniref:Sodium:proton antiporter n=1 Tax=Nocardia otitidiscaviarum TaxID=1823 RepID=A0A379JKG2_9NOCA|nr:DUF6328 family protein [Nocardia otitidiscaviarum]MBF6180230.1 sodium:proton antiporter [Nocardia otitidiscaviarum]SUD49087.1 Uncharacterised protein [Nocardia otitidiscaviarum]